MRRWHGPADGDEFKRGFAVWLLRSWWFPELLEARRASRGLACGVCTRRKRSSWNFDWLHNCTCNFWLAFSFDVTAVTMTNNDVQQRDPDWPLFQWTRMSNPTELSISAEDAKSWLCDFVPKVMCNQKDEGSGEASTKTSKLHLHQKLPLKCTTKTYPKTASTFSTSSFVHPSCQKTPWRPFRLELFPVV